MVRSRAVSGLRTGSTARLSGLLAVLALTVGAAAAAAGPGAGYQRQAARLQVTANRLDTRTHRALLGLYAVESRLGSARGRLATLAAQSVHLRLRQATLGSELGAARRTLAVSQQELESRLRMLYEQGRPDPLAILLGARSLQDALSKLDTLTRFADESRQVVAATRAAEHRLVRIRTLLARQRLRLNASLAAARSAAQQLAAARAEQATFVHGLHARQQLQESRIRALLATARSVETKAQQLQTAAAPAARTAPQPVGAISSSSPAPAVGSAAASTAPRTLRVSATGYSLPGRTATGMPVGWGVVAVDPAVIPLGTRLTIPDYGTAVAADVGSGVRGAMIDLWFPTLAQARAWGRRTVTISLH